MEYTETINLANEYGLPADYVNHIWSITKAMDYRNRSLSTLIMLEEISRLKKEGWLDD